MNHMSIIGFQFDDGGRAEAGLKGKTGDCVVRAIAIATGLDYTTLYKHLAPKTLARLGVNVQDDMPTYLKGVYHVDYEPLLKELGFTKTTSSEGYAHPTYTQAYQAFGNCLVLSHDGTHLSAIIDGELRDTFDHRFDQWDGETTQRKTTTIFHKWGGGWQEGQVLTVNE